MSVYSGIKRDGGRCTVVVTPEQQYCYQHDPHRATERKRNASRGGKSRTNRELAALKAENTDIRKQLLEGKILPGVAAVAVQSLNADVRIVAIGLKVREQLELIERLEALEETLNTNKRDKYSA